MYLFSQAAFSTRYFKLQPPFNGKIWQNYHCGLNYTYLHLGLCAIQTFFQQLDQNIIQNSSLAQGLEMYMNPFFISVMMFFYFLARLVDGADF